MYLGSSTRVLTAQYWSLEPYKLEFSFAKTGIRSLPNWIIAELALHIALTSQGVVHR